MHTIEDLVKVLYFVAFTLAARGYDEFSHKRVQRWCKTWNGRRIFFTEYSSPSNSRSVGQEEFQITLQGSDIKFISGHSYSIIVNSCFIDLDSMLKSKIDEIVVPCAVKSFLYELDRICNEIVKYYSQVQ